MVGRRGALDMGSAPPPYRQALDPPLKASRKPRRVETGGRHSSTYKTRICAAEMAVRYAALAEKYMCVIVIR